MGIAPSERMPDGEACPVATTLQQSYMGQLIPVCSFLLVDAKRYALSEGIAHAGYKEGVQDFRGICWRLNSTGKVPKALWVDPTTNGLGVS